MDGRSVLRLVVVGAGRLDVLVVMLAWLGVPRRGPLAGAWRAEDPCAGG